MRLRSCFTKRRKLTKLTSDTRASHLFRTLSPLARLGIRVPAEQPIQADIKRIGDVAKPIERQVNRRRRKVAARVGRQACTLRNLLRR